MPLAPSMSVVQLPPDIDPQPASAKAAAMVATMVRFMRLLLCERRSLRGSLPGAPGEAEPAGEEGEPAHRRDRAEPALPGEGEDVQAAAEKHGAGDEQPAGRGGPGARPAAARPA